MMVPLHVRHLLSECVVLEVDVVYQTRTLRASHSCFNICVSCSFPHILSTRHYSLASTYQPAHMTYLAHAHGGRYTNTSATVELYDCPLLGLSRGAQDCGRCIASSGTPRNCGWCFASASCVLSSSCAGGSGAGWNSGQLSLCAPPVVTGITPATGPITGGMYLSPPLRNSFFYLYIFHSIASDNCIESESCPVNDTNADTKTLLQRLLPLSYLVLYRESESDPCLMLLHVSRFAYFSHRGVPFCSTVLLCSTLCSTLCSISF